MYLPPQFASQDPRIAARLMREHPLASLITLDDQGQPFVTHLPLHLADHPAEEGGAFALLGHVARANPAWRHLSARPRATVTFLGPHAYMSPGVYPDLARVPTWNYLAVHCTVTARLLAHDDAAGKERLLEALIGDHEPAYAQQWRGLDSGFQRQMLDGIVAFELAVDGWQCKLKLNQHRPQAHAAMHAACAAGTPEQQALAGWMRALGMAPASSTQKE
ncbi:MAG: FMN-binding negative transcriptional regulator [Desulfovibrionaceae bacterium]|jgi:transcriptional regulator|nr:FMN-binding negative transcriptional regulator [Desulfovibrionaceae bacterium]